MARTNATNFAGGLQFPYATAATDLFHKEDIQVLAQAVDQHTHGTGKGLPIDVAGIPSNSITSSMILDRTITAGDIADGTLTPVQLSTNAITISQLVLGVASNPATTSASAVMIPDMSISQVTGWGGVGSSFVDIEFEAILTATPASVYFSVYLYIDGTLVLQRTPNYQTAGVQLQVTMHYGAVMAAAAHTFEARWSIPGGGTLTAQSTMRSLGMRDFHR